MKEYMDVIKYQRQDFLKRTLVTSIIWVIIQIIGGIITYFLNGAFTSQDLLIRFLSLIGGILITTLLNIYFMKQPNRENEE